MLDSISDGTPSSTIPPHQPDGADLTETAVAAARPTGGLADRLALTGLWRHHDFLRFWAAQTISDFGTQISVLALPLLAALTLDASPLAMGVLAAASSAPFLVIGLVVGAWVDRLRRRPIMIAADLGRAALMLTIPLAFALDALRIELLIAVAFMVGMLTVCFDVAYIAYLPSLVRRDQLLEGNAKLQASASVGQVAGPGLGGALVGLLTPAFALLIDAGSFLLSALCLSRIRAPEAPPERPETPTRIRHDIAEGLRAVRAQPVLRAIAACSATTSLFGFAFLAIYVLYLTDELGLGATGVGLIFSLGGVGALLGAMLANPAARRFGIGRTMIWGQALFGLFGLAVPLAVLMPSLALPMIAASECLQWGALLVYNVNAISLRQSLAPVRLHGRVNATMRFLISGAQPIGSLLGGALGALIGLPTTLVVTIIGMMLGVYWLTISPLPGVVGLPEAEE